MEQKSTRPPFGIGVRRFLGIGFHPSLDPTGAYSEKKIKLGPGEYFPAQLPKFCKYKNNGSTWTHENRLRAFSQNLGFRNSHILQERIFFKSLGGPGNYDVPEELFHTKSCNQASNVGFGKEKRFRSCIKQDGPPPGAYDGNILNTLFIVDHKNFNTTPPLEWDGFVNRFKNTSHVWNLAPNRYCVKDNGDIDALLNKFVSTRGPYDLFTGPRDNSTIKNHFSVAAQQSPDKYYTWATELDYILHHPDKRRYARFLKADRFPKRPTTRLMLNDLSMCYKNPNDPGPAHYSINMGGIRKQPPSKYPFNNSKLEARESTRWTNFPGPGRYTVKNVQTCKRKKRNMSWVFKSKCPRGIA